MITLTFLRKTNKKEKHSCWCYSFEYSEKYQEYYCLRGDYGTLVWDAREWELEDK